MSCAPVAARTVAVPGKHPAPPTDYCVPATWDPDRVLGAGAYAVVASFHSGEEEFAVKKVEHPLSHAVLALRTLREIRLLAHFHHPNVLGIQELFLNGPDFQDVYLRLEVMDGDLADLIHRGKHALSDYQVQCVLYQLVRGLLCLRSALVIHRDLKPGNVLYAGGGVIKIADLGLARSIEEGMHEAELTEYVVTRFYRAPEIVLTATKYTYAVDMWACGCIFGEMLMKRALFEGKDSLDQIRTILAVIGAPSAQDKDWIPQGSASMTFVDKMAAKCGSGGFFQRLSASGVNPLAVDLLARMLRFHPARRVPVEQAMQHRYLEAFSVRSDPEVQTAQKCAPVDWSFDRELCFDDRGRPKPFNERAFRSAFLEARELVRRREVTTSGGART